MSHILKKAFKIFTLAFSSLICLLVIIAITNSILTSVERGKYLAPGKMVEIDGKRMHIYSEGNGKENVILLSGFGTPSPVLDFYPLIKALSIDFTVAAIENYGYGWSDRTNKQRTNQNIVEETRLALKKVGILPPYILVPHSISGLYALYYTKIYPEEVSAIIGLDTSVPDQFAYTKSRKLSFYPVLRVLGIVRIALLLKPNIVGHNFPDYSDANRQMIRMMACWNLENKSLRNESADFIQNIQQLEDDIYPTTIPVSMILSKTSVEEISKGMPGFDWKRAHKDIIAGNKDGKIIILEGDHYIHWKNSKRIAAIIRETIQRKYTSQKQ